MVPSAFLFVPGDQASRIAKALQSDAGSVILDLEDAVRPENKAEARRIVADALANPPEGKRIIIRCNAVETPEFTSDLALLRTLPPLSFHAIMPAKCESAEAVKTLAEACPSGELLPLLESALGAHRLEAIASASPRIRQVAFGSVDFALDLGVPWTPEGDERRYAMGHLVLLSRALGLRAPVDAVYPKVDDEAAFIADAALGRRMGFGGKMVIHPRQIGWLREVYLPEAAEIAWSRRVVEAFEAAGGKGAIRLEGHLIDRPVYQQARQILDSVAAER